MRRLWTSKGSARSSFPYALVLGGLAGAALLTACPGKEPELDPKYADGGAGGATSSTGGPGPTSSHTGSSSTGGHTTSSQSSSTGQGAASSSSSSSSAGGASSSSSSGTGGGPCTKPIVGVCARDTNGVECALSNGTALGLMTTLGTAFSDVAGWDFPQNYETIRFPDLNGDGKADICGRASGGIFCALNTGAGFGALTLWSAFFNDTNGWDQAVRYTTIDYADVNGDGKMDICGRDVDGIHCALSDGTTQFGLATTVWADLTDAKGYTDVSYYSTIRYPDLNGDGKADMCVREVDGINCGLSDGTTFNNVKNWGAGFSDAGGWFSAEFYSTIRFPDLDGDGKADICAHAGNGINCGLSDGTKFSTPTLWGAQFSDTNGWGVPSAYSTFAYADVDGDGKTDLCARAGDGVHCAISDGTTFAANSVWSDAFADPVFGTPGYPIFYPDLDGDGKADVCGRSAAGMLCGLSDGTKFNVTLWSTDFTDAAGFGDPGSYTTMATPVLDTTACP